MDTLLHTGRVRLSISANDRRLTSAVLNRFLDWWDASGHFELVLPADVDPRPDVSWNTTTASITLPVHFAALPTPASDHTSRSSAQVESSRAAPDVLARRPQAGVDRDWVFEVVDDPADADLLFPSETASRRALDTIRRWRRHPGPVGRAARRLRTFAGRRPPMRVAAASVVLALAITAAIARPVRFAHVVPANRSTTPLSVTAPVAKTIEKPAALPSRPLSLFRPPSRVSPSRGGTAYIAAVRSAIQKNRRALPPKLSAMTKAATKDAKPAATSEIEYTGALVVRSEPSGAAVKIDGQTMGTTPFQIDRIRVGSHAIQVSLEGYPVWSTAATVVYDTSNEVVARLAR